MVSGGSLTKWRSCGGLNAHGGLELEDGSLAGFFHVLGHLVYVRAGHVVRLAVVPDQLDL